MSLYSFKRNKGGAGVKVGTLIGAELTPDVHTAHIQLTNTGNVDLSLTAGIQVGTAPKSHGPDHGYWSLPEGQTDSISIDTDLSSLSEGDYDVDLYVYDVNSGQILFNWEKVGTVTIAPTAAPDVSFVSLSWD